VLRHDRARCTETMRLRLSTMGRIYLRRDQAHNARFSHAPLVESPVFFIFRNLFHLSLVSTLEIQWSMSMQNHRARQCAWFYSVVLTNECIFLTSTLIKKILHDRTNISRKQWCSRDLLLADHNSRTKARRLPLRRIWFLSYAKSAVDTLYLLACNGSKRGALTNNITCHVQQHFARQRIVAAR